MNENDKRIQELLKDSFDSPTPSADFTLNVMEGVNKQVALKEAKGFEYKPVISKLGWLLIGGIFFAFVFLGLTGGEGSQSIPSVPMPELQYNLPVLQSQQVLFAFVSILFLLILDRAIKKVRMA